MLEEGLNGDDGLDCYGRYLRPDGVVVVPLPLHPFPQGAQAPLASLVVRLLVRVELEVFVLLVHGVVGEVHESR